ncbi:MAG TPA: bifunctional oligoribonuclease/PAP phosphatase NrnA [Spirochaetes bacterium]|nr:bifunctional oligoribonuclease/PAP phosphatase NrnA [Spirochaetota bacterium]
MPSGFINLDHFLSRHNKFIISTHESPDGDGLGAELAFSEILRNLGKTALILNSDPLPDKYRFIDPDNEIHVCADDAGLPEDLADHAVFVLDTNDFSNIGALHGRIEKRIKELFIIDHHEGGRDKIESNFIKVEASSTCEIIYSLFKYYDMVPSFKAAQALYTGILFDTGSFRYPKTTPETFKAAARLVELGANPFKIYEHIYESNSLSSFELESMILASMEIHYGGKLVALKLTPEMLRKSGAGFSEGELSINIPLTVEGVVASILVKQDIEGPVKVSMRTKGDYDVAGIAMANGGGGHKNAAGYKSKLSFDETFKKALREAGAFFEQAP